MKKIIHVPLIVFLLASCATTGDPVVVASQKATTSAFYTLDLFVKLEHNNRALADSISPEIHKAAQQVRLHGPQAPDPKDNYIQVVIDLTKAYQTNKNDTTKSALQKAIADLNALVAVASKYTTMLQSAKGTP